MSLAKDIRYGVQPAWPIIQQGKRYQVPALKPSDEKRDTMRTAVILPDMQLGYFRTGDNTLEAIHDEAAIDVALQLVRKAKPDQIILVGDNLDLCEFGKYRYTPAFARTTTEREQSSQQALAASPKFQARYRAHAEDTTSTGAPFTGQKTGSKASPSSNTSQATATST